MQEILTIITIWLAIVALVLPALYFVVCVLTGGPGPAGE